MIENLLAALVARDDPDPSEDVEVPGCRRPAESHRLYEITDAMLTTLQCADHVEPGGMAQSFKDFIRGGWLRRSCHARSISPNSEIFIRVFRGSDYAVPASDERANELRRGGVIRL